MSEYSNKFAVGIAEIVFIQFLHERNSDTTFIEEIVMNYEAFKNLHNIMGQVINQHEKNLLNQIEENKKMN